MTLYEIDFQMRKLLDSLCEQTIDPETGEVLSEGTTYDDLDTLAEERQQKMENIGLYLKEIDATIEAYKKEQDRIKAKIDHLKKKTERLENYVIDSMRNNGEKKFESLRAEMSIRESEFVDIDSNLDVQTLPTDYVKVKTEYSADKVALKKALKKGETFEGVTLGTRYNLNVK